MVFNYLLKVGETTEADLAAVAEQIDPRAKEAFVTTAEAIEARGEARGRTEMLIDLMTVKFGPLPEAVLRRVRSAEVDRLIGAVVRALSRLGRREGAGMRRTRRFSGARRCPRSPVSEHAEREAACRVGVPPTR